MTATCAPLARGTLVDPVEAAEMVGVTRNVIDVWANRELLTPLRMGRRVWYWSHDVYDAHQESRRTRDQQGRFARRITPL